MHETLRRFKLMGESMESAQRPFLELFQQHLAGAGVRSPPARHDAWQALVVCCKMGMELMQAALQGLVRRMFAHRWEKGEQCVGASSPA